MTVSEMKEHLNEVYQKLSGGQSELPMDESKNSPVRYVLRGSFRTNGVQLHLDAINTRIIDNHKCSQSKNRHKPEMKLMSAIRGDYGRYLREVQGMLLDQNAFLSVLRDNLKNKGRPWAGIDVLALDPGETFTVGARVRRTNDAKYRPNLAASWKALYQPRLKLRLLLENQKFRIVRDNTIASIESNPMSFRANPETREVYEATHRDALIGFYNNLEMKHLSHDWDAGRAHKTKFLLSTDRLLSMIGGIIGKKGEPSRKAAIEIGLGGSGTNANLTSQRSSFNSYLVGKECPFTCLVVGVNGFYTSNRRKWPAPDKIPPQIASSAGSVVCFLAEVRNIVKAKQDVTDLWDCTAQQIKILGLDLGQACARGASTLSPCDNHHEADGNDHMMNDGPTIYREIPTGTTDSIGNIENNLPSPQGKDTKLESYHSGLQRVEGELNAFYNGRILFKKHQWDASKVYKAEYAITIDCLLKLIGGSIGRQGDMNREASPGQFVTKARRKWVLYFEKAPNLWTD
ncbi:hypothetical protein BGX21_007688 [Mortierella sp. AD011]|nr:hypothetical protein BGX21_007688 [Mortierella sp. AD011]